MKRGYPPPDTPTTLDAYEASGRTALKLFEVSSIIEGKPSAKYTAADVRSWGLPVFGKQGGYGRVPVAALRRFLEGDLKGSS